MWFGLHQGWYNYDPKVGRGRKPLPSPEMQELINKYSMKSPQRGRKLEKDEIVRRVLYPLVNEAFKILEEGIASDPSDIDIIYLYGYGWPAFKGEPILIRVTNIISTTIHYNRFSHLLLIFDDEHEIIFLDHRRPHVLGRQLHWSTHNPERS